MKYLKFLVAVERATARPVDRALKKVMAEVDKDVNTAKWFLSRRQPETWGGRRRSETHFEEVEEVEEEETEKELKFFIGDRCDHAEVDCACPCDMHDLECETPPEDCICWQYHTPPKNLAGALILGI